MPLLTDLFKDARGATTIEYATICGAIVLVIVGVFSSVADETNTLWTVVSKKTEIAISGVRP